jgi:hypothetical protein
MEVIDYSEKSVAIIGETKEWIEELKQIGGRFNRNLKVGENSVPGWIFTKKKEDIVREFVEKSNSEQKNLPDMNKEKPLQNKKSNANINLPVGENKIEVINYTPKSLAIIGDTRVWSENIKELGGKFNRNLKVGESVVPGWIFSKNKEDVVKQFVENANSTKLEPMRKTSPSAGMSQYVSSSQQNIKYGIKSSSLNNNDNVVQNEMLTPVTILKHQSFTINYPTIFTSSDGLTYQVSIMPLPKIGQQVTLLFAGESLNYEIIALENDEPPHHNAIISSLPDDGTEPTQSPISVISGMWKVTGFEEEHTLIFHP